MDTAATFAHSPIIPVIDERIDIPRGAPKEQQQKIMVHNELLEEIYQRRTELETLEAGLAAMKFEIEEDMAHLALENSGELGKVEKKSGATAVMAFVPSSSPPTPNGLGNDVDGAEDGTMAGVFSVSLRSLVGATRGLKSRGKGKGRQERARLNGTDLRHRKIRFIEEEWPCN